MTRGVDRVRDTGSMMAAWTGSAVAAKAIARPAIAISLAASWTAAIDPTPLSVDVVKQVDVAPAADTARALLKEAIAKKPTRRMSNISASQIVFVGATLNIMLAVLKFAVGTLSGSAALLADAYHSASDLVVDGVTMVAVHAGSPAFERVCAFIIAAMLSSAGAAMIFDSMVTLLAATPPATAGAIAPFTVAIVAIASKEFLFRVTRQASIRLRSAVLLASAKHHLSDALSSLAAALGTCGVLLGLPVADALAAATVGAMLVHMGVVVARGDH